MKTKSKIFFFSTNHKKTKSKQTSNKEKKEASKAFPPHPSSPPETAQFFFLQEMFQEIVQQLRHPKSDFELTKNEKIQKIKRERKINKI